METLLTIIFVLLLSLSALLFFYSWIASLFIAAGKKRHFIAIILFIVQPTILFYNLIAWKETQYSRRFLLTGIILFFLCY